jgi:MerR family transcriptional regulator, light-induced transcriptional regulator
MIMAQLNPEILSGEQQGRVAVIASVEGELCELGVRIEMDFFEMEGWELYYVGANPPADSLIERIHKKQPDLVGL